MNRNFRSLKTLNSGITLLELIVVIAILGVLAATIIPSYIQYIEKAREKICNSNRNEILYMYKIEQVGLQSNICEGSQTLDLSTFVEEYISNNGNICPSGGNISANDGTLTIFCDKHGESATTDDSGGTDDNGQYLYQPGDIESTSDKDYYICTKETNLGPTEAPDSWQKVSTEGASIYNSKTLYKLGDVVKTNNNNNNNNYKYYICIVQFASISPPLDNNSDENSEWQKIK